MKLLPNRANLPHNDIPVITALHTVILLDCSFYEFEGFSTKMYSIFLNGRTGELMHASHIRTITRNQFFNTE